MSLTGIAVNAVGVVAGGCIALRQKLLESEAEQQQLINAEYAGLTSSIAAIKGAVDDHIGQHEASEIMGGKGTAQVALRKIHAAWLLPLLQRRQASVVAGRGHRRG